MQVTAKELREAAGQKTKHENINWLCKVFESMSWTADGREARFAGYDYKKHLVHFTSTWGVDGGGAGHKRYGVPVRSVMRLERGVAVDGLSGVVVLH